ncbi:hypothetical protein RDI58_004112 [Solanum bulbocastanum]|uniref:Reverse transcriptase zinc-binding domain-containing protein n=1 Tax=Solanum bulbocastanum TaxID=147425 RepID=A0AAN8U3K1_SOLBU
MVKHFIHQNNWNKGTLETTLPRDIVDEVLTIKFEEDRRDKPLWKLDSSGKFSCSSAFQDLRQKRPTLTQLEPVWNKTVPFKISFLMWRLHKKKLPLGNSLNKFGFTSNMDCVCCRSPVQESYNHLFAVGEMARRIWKWVSRPVGIESDNNNIVQILDNWWKTKSNNSVHKLILTISPNMVCWILWKARCSKKFSSKIFYKIWIYNQFVFQTKIVIAKKFGKMQDQWGWTNICSIAMMDYKLKLTSKMVKWNIHGDDLILNTDGSYMISLGRAGVGGIVRRRNGNMVIAFAKPIHFSTNNFSKACAAFLRISWCCH